MTCLDRPQGVEIAVNDPGPDGLDRPRLRPASAPGGVRGSDAQLGGTGLPLEGRPPCLEPGGPTSSAARFAGPQGAQTGRRTLWTRSSASTLNEMRAAKKIFALRPATSREARFGRDIFDAGATGSNPPLRTAPGSGRVEPGISRFVTPENLPPVCWPPPGASQGSSQRERGRPVGGGASSGGCRRRAGGEGVGRSTQELEAWKPGGQKWRSGQAGEPRRVGTLQLLTGRDRRHTTPARHDLLT